MRKMSSRIFVPWTAYARREITMPGNPNQLLLQLYVRDVYFPEFSEEQE